MGKIIRDISIIVVLAIVLAFTYNAFSEKPLPLIPKTQEEMKISEDIFYGDFTATLESLNEYNVTYGQLKSIIGKEGFIIIDARRPEAYAEGHITNAVNIFPYSENPDDYFGQLVMLPRDKTIIIYCDGGTCDLSHHVAEELINMGYPKVFLYRGGWEDWSEKEGN